MLKDGGIKNESRMREVRSGRMGVSRVLLWVAALNGLVRWSGQAVWAQ